MASSTRISGKKNPIFSLGSPGTSYANDLTAITLENEDGDADTITFEDAASGGSRQFFIRGTAVQSTATGSLWAYLWDNSGSVDIDFVYGIHGNATPTVAQPHFTGKATLGPKPTLGGEANVSSTSAQTFDFELTVNGVPTKKTAA